MILKNRVHIWLFGLLALTACSAGDDATSQNVSAPEITLSAGIEAMDSRAGTNLLNTSFAVNNRLGVYINELTIGTPSVTYNQPIQYIVSDKLGNIRPLTETVPCYPTSGNQVKITAFYPYAAITDAGNYTIKTNQTDNSGYQNSDLMSASVTGRNTSGALNLEFKHLCSKITYHLTTSDPDVILNGSRVSLLNVKKSASVNAALGTIGIAYGETSEPIVVSYDGGKDGSAIILPQSINGNTQFIEVVLYTGEVVYGVMPTTYTFLEGKSYLFNLDVKVDRVASTITLGDIQIIDWVDETPQEIEGERTN